MRKKGKLTDKQKQIFFLGIPKSLRRKSDWLFGYTIDNVPVNIKTFQDWSFKDWKKEEKRFVTSVTKPLKKFKSKDRVTHIKVIFSFTGDVSEVEYYFACEDKITTAIQGKIKCSINIQLEYMLKFGEERRQTNILIK